MTRERQPKKSETVEIRLPHATKIAFMARCRTQGQTASDAIRGFIETELESRKSGSGLTGWRAFWAAVLAILVLGAVAAPSLAQGVAPARVAFDRLDHDGNGALSFEEFRDR